MRPFALLGVLASTCLLANPAHASFTIDLIWSDTGPPTLTVSPTGPNTSPAGTPCGDGFLSTAGSGRCLEVRLTAGAAFKAAIVSLGWNAASSGIALDHVGAKSFGAFGSGPPGVGPVHPGPVDPSQCGFCDTAYGGFGGIAGGTTAPGTYVVGSLHLDLAAANIGLHHIASFLLAGTDGAIDKSGSSVPVHVNGAVLHVTPEPGAAALLGLGLVGLAGLTRGRSEER